MPQQAENGSSINAFVDNDESAEEQQKSWFDGISNGSIKAFDSVGVFSKQLKKMRGLNLRFVSLEQSIRELTFYPLTGLTLDQILERRGWTDVYKNSNEWRNNVASCCGGDEVQMRTTDGRQITGLWCPRAHDAALKEREFQYLASPDFLTSLTPETLGASKFQRVELPAESAVILFHANAMISLDMVSHILWYRCRGMHVLTVTLGGYADSEGEPSEISSYLDAECALNWLCKRCPALSVKRVVLHGLSLGGAIATGLATQYPHLHLTLDQTFVNATEVAQIVAKMAFDDMVPEHMVASVIKTAFPIGVTHSSSLATQASQKAAETSDLSFSSFTSSFLTPKAPPYSFGHPRTTTPPTSLSSDLSLSSEGRGGMMSAVASKLQESHFTCDSYNTEYKLVEIGNLEHEQQAKGSFTVQDPVGQLFVLSSNQDVMMPLAFADRLLQARYHHRLHPVSSASLQAEEEEEGGQANEEQFGDVKHEIVKSKMNKLRHELLDEDGNKIKSFAEIQAWNSVKTGHYSLIKGGHGTFFGDQAEPSSNYQRYLENLGLIATRRNYTLAIQEARNIVYSKQQFKSAI